MWKTVSLSSVICCIAKRGPPPLGNRRDFFGGQSAKPCAIFKESVSHATAQARATPRSGSNQIKKAIGEVGNSSALGVYGVDHQRRTRPTSTCTKSDCG